MTSSNLLELAARDVRREIAINPIGCINTLLYCCAFNLSNGHIMTPIEHRAKLVLGNAIVIQVAGKIALESQVNAIHELCMQVPQHSVDLLCIALSMSELDDAQCTDLFSIILVLDNRIKEIHNGQA
jgi:hypothetical protein